MSRGCREDNLLYLRMTFRVYCNAIWSYKCTCHFLVTRDEIISSHITEVCSCVLEDTRLWFPDSSHIFSCKSAFNKLRETLITNVFSPFKVIWKSPIPHKIKLFAWLVALGRVNTCDVLQKKRPNCTLNPSWCVMCKREEETVDHLFIHFSFGSRIWWKILRTFGLYWVVPGSCYGLLLGQAQV